MSTTTHFAGPVQSTNGFVGAVTGAITGNLTGNVTGNVTGAVLAVTPVNATAATLTVTQATHAGRVVTLNRATGVTVTLPAAAGTGSVYVFEIGTTTSGGSQVIKVANSSDVINGFAHTISDDAGAPMKGYKAAATDDTITLNGTTTGGLLGDLVVITDVATNIFHAQVMTASTGTEATPFSATV